MKRRSILLILLVVVGAGWLVHTHLTPAPEAIIADRLVGTNAPRQSASDRPVAPKPLPAGPSVAAAVPPSSEHAAENAISSILLTSKSDTVAAAGRLATLVLNPDFPAAQRSEALSHLLNLSVGHENELLLPLVRDPRLSATDCRTLLDDSLNQSTAWQGEVFLAALGARPEPDLRAHIRAHLGFLTGRDDLGDDPRAWLEPLAQAAEKTSP